MDLTTQRKLSGAIDGVHLERMAYKRTSSFFDGHFSLIENPNQEAKQLRMTRSFSTIPMSKSWKQVSQRSLQENKYDICDFECFLRDLLDDPTHIQFFNSFVDLKGKTGQYLLVKNSFIQSGDSESENSELNPAQFIETRDCRSHEDSATEEARETFACFVYPCFLHSIYFSAMLTNAEGYLCQDDRVKHNTLVHSAIRRQNVVEFDKLVLGMRFPILVRNAKGNIAIHEASRVPNPHFMKIIAEMQPDTRIQNAKGNTALHIAVENNKQVLKELLAIEPEYNIANRKGMLPIDLASGENRESLLDFIFSCWMGWIDQRFYAPTTKDKFLSQQILHIGDNELDENCNEIFDHLWLLLDLEEDQIRSKLDDILKIVRKRFNLEKRRLFANLSQEKAKEHKMMHSCYIESLKVEKSKKRVSFGSNSAVEKLFSFIVYHIIGNDRSDYRNMYVEDSYE